MTHLTLDLNVEELSVLEQLLQNELNSQRRDEPPETERPFPTAVAHYREVLASLADRVTWLHNTIAPRREQWRTSAAAPPEPSGPAAYPHS
jgi:hypothetical protein